MGNDLQTRLAGTEDSLTGLAEFIVTMTSLMDDTPRQPVDGVVFHSRATGDDDGLFKLAGEFYKAKKVKKIIVNGGDGRYEFRGEIIQAWPGADYYLERLKENGVTGKGDILFSARADNTRAENDAFLEVMMNNHFKSGIIIAQPHQLPRAFAGMLAAMRLASVDLDLYAAAPSGVDWDKTVRGSPRAGEKPRRQHVSDEMEGIAKYTPLGHLVPSSYIDQYRKLRDARQDFVLRPLEEPKPAE
jgi:hypothetical protein